MNIVFDIPNGPKNLSSYFPTIDWSDVDSYEVSIKSANGDTMAIFHNEISCCCNEDKIRINFVNSLGRVDGINFNHKEETLETRSDTWHKSLNYPLVKSDGGFQRFNIKSNETYKGVNLCYSEADMEWVKELFTSPRAWIEWKGQEDQPDAFIPIIILDKKIITIKKEDRYYYEINIDFAMANDNIHLRN